MHHPALLRARFISGFPLSRRLGVAAFSLLALAVSARAATPAPLRAGMIGLDTSHVPAFVKLFNDPKAAGDIAGIKIVAAYPGGTDMPASRTRVAKFTEGVRAAGVEIVDSIPKLLEKVDVVFLESVDGRIHLQEATPVLKAGKPLWIDKPAGGTLADAIAIYELAKKHGTPCFSSSALRFTKGVVELSQKTALGKLVGAVSWGPCDYEPGTPDLFFYGIHASSRCLRSWEWVANPSPVCRRRTSISCRGSGGTAGSPAIADFAMRRAVSVSSHSARRRLPRRRPAALAAIGIFALRSLVSSRPARCPSPPRRPSRFSRSWRPPTKASARAAGR